MKGAIYLKRVSTNMPTHFHEWHLSGEGWKERIMKAERKKKTSVAGGDKKAPESKTRALWPRPSRGVTLRAASCHLSRTKCSSQTPAAFQPGGALQKGKKRFLPKALVKCECTTLPLRKSCARNLHQLWSSSCIFSWFVKCTWFGSTPNKLPFLPWTGMEAVPGALCFHPVSLLLWQALIARPGCSSKEQQTPQMNTQIQCGGNQVQSQNKLGVHISFLSPEQWLSSGGKVRFARKHEPLSIIISYNKVSRGTRRLFRALLQILVPTKSNVRQTLTCVFKNKEQFAGLLTSFFPSKPRNQHILFPLLLQQLWA